MPLPPQLNLVTVHATYPVHPGGAAETGSVTFYPGVRHLQVPAADAIVTLSPVKATLDATGAISVQLPATNDPDTSPTGWTWRVVEDLAGRPVRSRFIALDHAAGTVELADIPDAVPGPAVVTYALAASLAQYVRLDGNNNVDLTADLALGFADINIDHADPLVDVLAFRYLGARTGYHNEFGEVRGVAAKATTVAARFRRKASNSTANIVEFADENNVPFVYVEAGGALRSPNLEPGAWLNPTYETGASGTQVAESGTTFDAAAGRIESTQSGVVRLRGCVGTTGSFGSGAFFMTLPLALRPSATRAMILRTSAPNPPGTGVSVQARVRIDTNGQVSVNTALSAGTNIHLDGLTYTL